MNPGRSEILGEYAANPERSAEGFGGTSIITGWCAKCRTAKKPIKGECPDGCGGSLTTREWKASALEDGLTGQFEVEVRRRARMAYIDAEQTDPAEGTKMRMQYTADFSAGRYNWDDDGANTINYVKGALRETWGALYLVYLLLRRCDSTVTQAQTMGVWRANPEDAVFTCLWAQAVVGLNPNPQTPSAQRGDGVDLVTLEKTIRTMVRKSLIDQGLVSAGSSGSDASTESAQDVPQTTPKTERTFD